MLNKQTFSRNKISGWILSNVLKCYYEGGCSSVYYHKYIPQDPSKLHDVICCSQERHHVVAPPLPPLTHVSWLLGLPLHLRILC